MSWTRTADVAVSSGANWDDFIKKVRKCTPEEARRISLRNPRINSFFICRDPIRLGDKGDFIPGDAVFFSGSPRYTDAPGCDFYERNHMTTVYINPKNSHQFKNIANYTSADGSPAVDVVCIFAGNYSSNRLPYLRANNNNPPTTKEFNPNIHGILVDGSVKFLQDKGITVLLTILNGHSPVGWSQFTSETDAMDFVKYLKAEVVDKYGLDGIDIDDEYSTGDPNNLSMVMVTSIMQQMMPDKIISKALYSDLQDFTPVYKGKRLSETLDYGWEMSYGGAPEDRLPPYVDRGMSRTVLSLGFWSGSASPDPKKYVQWVKYKGFGGVMVFAFENRDNVRLMATLVEALYGPGNWNYK